MTLLISGRARRGSGKKRENERNVVANSATCALSLAVYGALPKQGAARCISQICGLLVRRRIRGSISLLTALLSLACNCSHLSLLLVSLAGTAFLRIFFFFFIFARDKHYDVLLKTMPCIHKTFFLLPRCVFSFAIVLAPATLESNCLETIVTVMANREQELRKLCEYGLSCLQRCA